MLLPPFTPNDQFCCGASLADYFVDPVCAVPLTVLYHLVLLAAKYRGKIERPQTVVELSFVHDSHIVAGTEHLWFARHILPAVISVERNVYAAVLAALGCYKNNTVGCACAVNGGGSGILEHVDAFLDIVGVEVIEIALCCPRFSPSITTMGAASPVVPRPRMLTLYPLRLARNWIRYSGPGGTGECSYRRYCIEFAYVVAFDLHGGAGNELLLKCTITDGNNFVERVAGRLKHKMYTWLSSVTAASRDIKPMNDATRDCPVSTFVMKFPSMSVTTPMLLPF